jgi:predicted Zn-dependent protease
MSRCRAVVLLLTAALAGGCTPTENSGINFGQIAAGFDPTGIAPSALNVGQAAARATQRLTPQQHYYLGRAVAANILSQYPVYQNAAAARYVNELGTSLAAASDMPYVFNGYTFIILDSDETNAFALPGAYVLITRGMLRCCETEDQLAAVLAHEIAHVQREHALQAISKDRWGEVLKTIGQEGAGHAAGQSGVPVGEAARSLAGAAGDVSKKLMTDGYSRQAEAEADRDAVVLLQRVGYDPNALVQMLQRMGERVSPGSPGFGRTHPPAAARIQSVRPLIKTPPVDPPAARQQRFEQALAGVLAS